MEAPPNRYLARERFKVSIVGAVNPVTREPTLRWMGTFYDDDEAARYVHDLTERIPGVGIVGQRLEAAT